MTRAWMLLLALLPAACDNAGAGADAYRDGRFADAHRMFAEEEAAAAGDVPPEILMNRALAALRAGDMQDAADAAERAAADGDPGRVALREFITGNIAFARSERLEEDAQKPGAPPVTWDRAIAFAEAARNAWRRAAASRDDWPEARRNVERALLRLDALKDQRPDPERKKDGEKTPRPKPRPAPPPPLPGTDPKDAAAAGRQTKELTPAEVQALLQRLAEKERERLDARRAQREAASSGVERDW